MLRRSRLLFAVMLIAVVIATDLAVQFYRVYSAPPPPPFLGPAYLAAEYHQLNEHLTNSGYWITDEHHGFYYNFSADGERRVVGQPRTYLHTIWLFGNSGTQDPYVTDAQSMASRLQAMLPAFRIVNRSAGGQHISGEMAWLRETPVQAGDMVIFVDGGMDHGAPVPYWNSVRVSRLFVTGKGALWLHLVQPSSFSLDSLVPFVDVPGADFVDGVHLNAHGDALVAVAVYDAVTLI